MRQSTIWSLLVIVVILAGLVAAVNSVRKTDDGTVATSTTAVLPPLTATYYCQGGTIAATFTEGAAHVEVSTGKKYDLASVISASGARYEQGAGTQSDIVFWTKGNNAFLTENDKTILDNCVAGTAEPAGNGTASFTDASKLFTFDYPTAYAVSGSQVGYSTEWRQQTTSSGMLLAQVAVPKDSQPKTNFSEAKFTVGVSGDADAVRVCLTDGTGGAGTVSSSKVTINGQQFTKLSFSDAGAGNYYDTTSYRTVKDNQCYAVEYTIHSTNIGNYSPDQGIVQFNKDKVLSTLEGIVTSFKFVK